MCIIMLMLHISRIFAIYLVIFLFSVATFTLYPIEFDGIYLLSILVLIGGFWKIKKARHVLLLLLIIGIAAARVSPFSNNEDLDRRKLDSTGTIFSEPTLAGNKQKFVVLLKGLGPDEGSDPKGKKVEITTNQAPKYRFGEILHLEGLTSTDYINYSHKSKGIVAKISYPKIAKIGQNMEPYFLVRKKLINVKNFFKTNISKSLPEPNSGLVSGILLGEKADISDGLKTSLSRTGTTHIIALSGFNITIVAIFLSFALQGLPKKISYTSIIGGIFCFILATGFSASAIRAGIMGVLLVSAKFFGRKSDGLVAILFAAALMVFINPMILLYDIGFQLSFAAACGIVFLVPILDKKMSFFGKKLLIIISPTIAAIVFTWPISAYYFGVFSNIALLTNILIVPFVEVVMFFGLILAIVSEIGGYALIVIQTITWAMSSYILQTINIFSKISWAVTPISIGSPIFLIGYYMLLFDIILVLGRKKIAKTKTV